MLFGETWRDGRPVVTLSGRLDNRAAEACAQRLLPLIVDGRRALVMDMAEVDYVGEAGVRVLLMLGERAGRLGGGLRLCRPQSALTDVLAVGDFTDRLRVYDDVASGVA